MKKKLSLLLLGLTAALMIGCGAKAESTGKQINSADDLEGAKIGVQLGTIGDIYVSDMEGDEAGTTVERYNKITDAVQALRQGKIDCVIVDEQPAIATTKDEKKNILERFNTVKTINEGKILHAAIKAELSESKKSAPIVEKQFVAGKENLNETTIYSNMSNPSLDLMNRMDSLYK